MSNSKDNLMYTLSSRFTPPMMAVLFPDPLALAKSASCLESSALRSKNELALIPLALDLLV